ncbi:MAG: APC family permease, partial [Planctomycetota bacterium]
VPNLIGHRQSAWTQNLTTILKLGLFVVLVVMAFVCGGGNFAHITEGQSIGKVGLGTAATQLFYVMFAYSGWNAASYLAGEVRNPGNILPRSLLLGTGLVIVLYLALNLVFAYAVPLADVGFDNALFGPRASSVFSVLLGLAFLATVSAFVITGPRVYYAMAKDGLFPSVAGRVSSKGRIPVYAMLAQSACAIIILFVTDFQNLYKYASVGLSIFAMLFFQNLYKYASVGLSIFAMLFIAAVYVLRWRRPDMQRPFRVPGYPLVPAIFMIVVLFMTVFAFIQWRRPSVYSLGSILLGIPVYYLWSLARRRRAA